MANRYLVTGGAGFIGSHLSEALVQRGDVVVALDNLWTGSHANLDRVADSPQFAFQHGSVLDELMVDELVQDSDVVVHLAAAVGVRLVVDNPLKSLITNIRGAETMIAAAHRYRKPILVVSTSEVYGKNTNSPLSEDSDRVLGAPSVARWAYSIAKTVDEILALAFYRERGLPTRVLRLFNTVGPRQTGAYGMVIPRFVDQALAGEDLTVYGDGSQTRCFCHVRDVVRAICGLLDTPESVGQIVNVGSTEEVTMLELARRVILRTGSTSAVRLVPYEEAFGEGFEDMMRRVPDTTRVEALIGWRPTYSLDEILDDVIAEASSKRASDVLAPRSRP